MRRPSIHAGRAAGESGQALAEYSLALAALGTAAAGLAALIRLVVTVLAPGAVDAATVSGSYF